MSKIKSSQVEALFRPENDKEGNLIEYKYLDKFFKIIENQ